MIAIFVSWLIKQFTNQLLKLLRKFLGFLNRSNNIHELLYLMVWFLESNILDQVHESTILTYAKFVLTTNPI